MSEFASIECDRTIRKRYVLFLFLRTYRHTLASEEIRFLGVVFESDGGAHRDRVCSAFEGVGRLCTVDKGVLGLG